jgi:hypothetical protein
MNHAARYVLVILGIVLLIFASDAVLAPYFGKEAPKAVTDHLAELIIAFVGVLAKTGKDVEPQGNQTP